MSIAIRAAQREDLPAILSIYNEVIANTTAVYQEEPVTLSNRADWLSAKEKAGFPVFVAVRESDVLGFATFGEFRAWPCYRHTVEHSVHVRADGRGCGIGRELVETLLISARTRGAHVMVAGIDALNQGSIALHRSLGFVEAGLLREVGHKFGRWLDLTFMHKLL